MVMAAVLEAATSAAVIDGHLLAAGHSSDKGRWDGGDGRTGGLKQVSEALQFCLFRRRSHFWIM